jgi:CBS domain-containing protein
MPIVGDLLSGRPPLALSSSASVLQAARLMTERKVKAVLITSVDGSPGRLEGIFTEHDLMTRVVAAERDPRTFRLGEAMTRELFTVTRDAKVDVVRGEMQRRHISHVPVVEQGQLVGLLSLRDVLRADFEEKAHEVAELEGYFLGGIDAGTA